jgi:RNA polymerase sigma-70 factor (ECF subfamily)
MEQRSQSDPASFLASCAPRLRAYLRVLLKDEADTEDALQEVFLKYLEKGPPSDLKAERWLMRVARNQALDERRSEIRRKARERTAGERLTVVCPDPANQIGDAEEAAKMDRCLRQLDLEHREMVYLSVVEQWPVRKIAERTGVSKSTVAQRVQEGLVLLNRLFHGDSLIRGGEG